MEGPQEDRYLGGCLVWVRASSGASEVLQWDAGIAVMTCVDRLAERAQDRYDK